MSTMNMLGHLNSLSGNNCGGCVPLTGFGPAGRAQMIGMLPVAITDVNADAYVLMHPANGVSYSGANQLVAGSHAKTGFMAYADSDTVDRYPHGFFSTTKSGGGGSHHLMHGVFDKGNRGEFETDSIRDFMNSTLGVAASHSFLRIAIDPTNMLRSVDLPVERAADAIMFSLFSYWKTHYTRMPNEVIFTPRDANAKELVSLTNAIKRYRTPINPEITLRDRAGLYLQNLVRGMGKRFSVGGSIMRGLSRSLEQDMPSGVRTTMQCLNELAEVEPQFFDAEIVESIGRFLERNPRLYYRNSVIALLERLVKHSKKNVADAARAALASDARVRNEARAMMVRTSFEYEDMGAVVDEVRG